jgi:sodium transport system ATP-binding protein
MISVHELTKTFSNNHHEILAVDHLTFRVSAGEVFGLLGPNGAGKTTTVRMILGLLTPTSGYAEVEGLRSSEFPDEVKRRVGLVSASAGLYQWLTSREVLLFFADLYGLDPDRAEERLGQLSELMDLRPFLDQRCSTLSTGQRQRVQLARALIHDPPIMLLDEPTRGLDVFGSQAIFDYIGQLRQQGRAVIVTTHRLDEAQRLCDRFGLMHRGRFVLEGTLDELRQKSGRETLVDMFIQFARAGEAASSFAVSDEVPRVDSAGAGGSR